MVQIASNTAQAEFEALLDRAERGEDIRIVRGGRVFSLRAEPRDPDVMTREEAVALFRTLKAKKPMTEDELISIIHESRR